jgi:hypothetical protein
MDIRLGTWNVRSLYKAGSLVTVLKELSKYRLDLVGVQVRWEGGGTEPAGEYTVFYGKGNENHVLSSGNASYHSVQRLLSSCLLSKNLKMGIYNTIILPVVLYGCKI